MFEKPNVEKLVWKGIAMTFVTIMLGITWRAGQQLEDSIDAKYDKKKDHKSS